MMPAVEWMILLLNLENKWLLLLLVGFTGLLHLIVVVIVSLWNHIAHFCVWSWVKDTCRKELLNIELWIDKSRYSQYCEWLRGYHLDICKYMCYILFYCILNLFSWSAVILVYWERKILYLKKKDNPFFVFYRVCWGIHTSWKGYKLIQQVWSLGIVEECTSCSTVVGTAGEEVTQLDPTS